MRIVYALALLLLIGPVAFRYARQDWLRNLAIWLALFAAAGLAYQIFGSST